MHAVAPRLARSELTRKLWESESAVATSRAMHALGRLGEPEEVAVLIAWQLDPANSCVTGQVIGIDGGLASVTVRNRA